MCGIKKNPFKTVEDIHAKDASVLAQTRALGYTVLIIWTHELQSNLAEGVLLARIKEFNEQ